MLPTRHVDHLDLWLSHSTWWGNKKVPTSMEQLSIGRKWSCTCNCIAKYNNFIQFLSQQKKLHLALQLPKVSEHPACLTNQFRTSFLKENLWECHWFSQGRSPRRINPWDLATEVGWLAEKLMVHIKYSSFYQQFQTCEVVGLGMSEPSIIDTLQ